MQTKFIVISLITALLLPAFGSETKKAADLKKHFNDAVKREMEKEKLYAKEQKFYGEKDYDFKGAEIDPAVLDTIPYEEPDYNHTDDWGVCDQK